jgi:hypothetical protein
MKLENREVSFLKGHEFTSGLVVPLNRPGLTESRNDRLGFLRELVRGKDIIHIGCVDHMPLIEGKRKSGHWLHDILISSARLCVGIDINREGVEHLKTLGVGNVYTMDILKDDMPAELKGKKFDYLVLGEMIEHVDNPVDFLAAVRKKFAGQARELVTTTPNVFRIQNLINTLRAREYINSDHRYWFSPYTLAKVLSQAGYDDVEIDLVWDAPLRTGFSGMAKRLIGATWPATRDCLIARSHLN